MLRTKAIRKIFMTTLSMFIILTVFSLSTLTDENVLRTNLEIEDITGIVTNNIYLLSENGYLVRKSILLDSDDVKEKINKALTNMIQHDENKYSNKLIGPIPKGTVINDIICESDLIIVDFSKELLDVSVGHEKHMISAIVYTIMDIVSVDGISIMVDGEILKNYPNTGESLPNILDKSIGINKSYDITSRENVSKVVVYYLDNIEEELYYVPVTKYVNDSREKINIVVEELSSSYIYEENLMSFLNSKVQLLNYSLEDDVLFLNFNEYLFDSNDIILEEVLYCISYSVFDNYDVSMVMFEVNGEEVNHVLKSELI